MMNRNGLLRLTFTIFLTFILSNVSIWAQSKNQQKYKLEWEDDGYAFEYRVELRTTDDGVISEGERNTDSKKGSVGRSQYYDTEDSYIEINLAPGNYEYRVIAFDFLGRESSVSEWQRFSVIKAKSPVVQELKQNVVVSENEKARFSVPLEVSSITEDTKVELINTVTKEKITGELRIQIEGNKIVSSEAVFPEVPGGNWKAKITNPSGMFTETPEIEVAKTVEKAIEIAENNERKIFIARTDAEKKLYAKILEKKAEEKRIAEEARIAEEKRIAEEARVAEELRIAEERRIAEEQRIAEEARIAEELRIAEEQRLAEEKRIAEEQRIAEEARVAEELRIAEEQRKAEEARVAEEQRIAEEQRKAEEARVAEEKQIAEEQRKAEEARIAEEKQIAEEQRKAEEARVAEEKQIAEEQRIVEEQRKAEEARVAEEKQIAEEQRKAEEARVAEEKRIAEEQRKAEEARIAEEKQIAEEQRKAEEARVAEEKQIAEEQRKAEDLRIEKIQNAQEREVQKAKEVAVAIQQEAEKTAARIEKIDEDLENLKKQKEAAEELLLNAEQEKTEKEIKYIREITEIMDERQSMAEESSRLADKVAFWEQEIARLTDLIKEEQSLELYDYNSEDGYKSPAYESMEYAVENAEKALKELNEAEKKRTAKEAALEKKQEKIYSKIKRLGAEPLELNLLAGLNGMYSPYDGTLMEYKDILSEAPLYASAEVKLSYLPFKRKNDKFGFSIESQVSELFIENDLLSLKLPVIISQLNFEYNFRIIEDFLYIGVYGGAGTALFAKTIGYKDEGLRENPDYKMYGFMTAQTGAAVQFIPFKNLVIETGLKFTHIFIPGMQTGLLEPYILAGYRW